MKSSPGFWTHENRAVFLLTLAFGFVFFDRNALSFLTPQLVPALGLSNLQVGMLSSGLSLTWAVSGFLVSMFADAKGQRSRILVVAILVFSLCSFASGLAASFLGLLLARMLMGLAEGPILPISQAVMIAESSPHRRGLNMGVLQSLGSALLGSFAAPLLLVAIAQAHGWRSAFFVAGVPGVLLAVMMWKALREPPARESAPLHERGTRPRLLPLLRERNVFICVATSCCLIAWMVLGWAFLPLYYTKVRQLAGADMSIVMAGLGVAAALFGAFVGPGLSDRFGRKPLVLVLCALGALTPLSALYYQGPLAGFVVLAFVGWSAAGAMPLVIATIPAETVAAHQTATAISLAQGVGEIVGGVLAPVIAGKVADLTSLSSVLQIQTGCAVLAFLLACGLAESAPGVVRRAGKPAMAMP